MFFQSLLRTFKIVIRLHLFPVGYMNITSLYELWDLGHREIRLLVQGQKLVFIRIHSDGLDHSLVCSQDMSSELVLSNISFFKKNVFIYLSAPGLSCSMQDILVVACELLPIAAACEI